MFTATPSPEKAMRGFAAQAQVLPPGHPPVEEVAEIPVDEEIAVGIGQDGQGVEAAFHRGVPVGVEGSAHPGQQAPQVQPGDDHIVDHKGDVLHRVPGDAAKKDIPPAFVKAEFAPHQGDEKEGEKEGGQAPHGVSGGSQGVGRCQGEGRHEAEDQPQGKTGTAAQFAA